MHHVVLINVVLRQSCLVHLGDEPPHRLLARVGDGTKEQQELECAEERRRRWTGHLDMRPVQGLKLAPPF